MIIFISKLSRYGVFGSLRKKKFDRVQSDWSFVNGEYIELNIEPIRFFLLFFFELLHYQTSPVLLLNIKITRCSWFIKILNHQKWLYLVHDKIKLKQNLTPENTIIKLTLNMEKVQTKNQMVNEALFNNLSKENDQNNTQEKMEYIW